MSGWEGEVQERLRKRDRDEGAAPLQGRKQSVLFAGSQGERM